MKQHHRIRRLALQSLCCLDVQGNGAMDLATEFISDSKESEDTILAAETMMVEAWAAREQSDELLQRHARHWDLKRLALVDRNILRMAVYEMLAGKTPPKVVIAEALRLAQEFSTAQSPGFINGILDAIYKQLRNDK